MGNIDGFKQALLALQALDEPSRLRILRDIAQANPDLAKRLKEGLFSFADLQYLLASDFRVIWWECPRNTWSLALRKAPVGVMKMIESNLSKRAVVEFKEQIDLLGPQPVAKVLEAQKEICDLIRELVGQGRMAPPSSKKNDPMV
jgi:flagellar motor switch protein FliG